MMDRSALVAAIGLTFITIGSAQSASGRNGLWIADAVDESEHQVSCVKHFTFYLRLEGRQLINEGNAHPHVVVFGGLKHGRASITLQEGPHTIIASGAFQSSTGSGRWRSQSSRCHGTWRAHWIGI